MITSRVDQALSFCPSYAAQVSYANVPRPPTAENCGAHSLNAGKNILTEMYWTRQYLRNLGNYQRQRAVILEWDS